MSLALCLAAASHDGEDVNVPIEACCWQHCRIPGTPLDVEAPLAAGRQLIQDLQNQIDIPVLTELQSLPIYYLLLILHFNNWRNFTSAVLGFQHRILLSFPQLRSNSGSAILQAIERTPLLINNISFRCWNIMEIKRCTWRFYSIVDVVYRVWFSKILSGEVAKRKSHIWMTGIRSSSEAKINCVATSGFQANPEQCI